MQKSEGQQRDAVSQLAEYQAEYATELDSIKLQHEQAAAQVQAQHQMQLQDLTALHQQAQTQVQEQQLKHEQAAIAAHEQHQCHLDELRAYSEHSAAKAQLHRETDRRKLSEANRALAELQEVHDHKVTISVHEQRLSNVLVHAVCGWYPSSLCSSNCACHMRCWSSAAFVS